MHKSSASGKTDGQRQHHHGPTNMTTSGASLPFSIDQILSSSSSQMKQVAAVHQAISAASLNSYQQPQPQLQQQQRQPNQQQAANMLMLNQAASSQRNFPAPAMLNEQLALLMAAQQQQQQQHREHSHNFLNPTALAAAAAQQQLHQQLVAAAAAAALSQQQQQRQTSVSRNEPSSEGALNSLSSLVSQQTGGHQSAGGANPNPNHLFSCFMASMLIQQQHHHHQQQQHAAQKHLMINQQPRLAPKRLKGTATSLISTLDQQQQQQHAKLVGSQQALLAARLNAAAVAAAAAHHQHPPTQLGSGPSGQANGGCPPRQPFGNLAPRPQESLDRHAHLFPGPQHHAHRLIQRRDSSSLSPPDRTSPHAQQHQLISQHQHQRLQTSSKERRSPDDSPPPPPADQAASGPTGGGASSGNLKPAHSYIGLIAMCILSTPEKRMVLNDIYQFILDHYPYYRNRGSGWRNSVRHNLSLNECFQKDIRAPNGKGHYWRIHPANMADFMNGDFRRRRAQRQVRRHNNMEVPSDESDDESMEDATRPPLPEHFKRSLEMHKQLELIYGKSGHGDPANLAPPLPLPLAATAVGAPPPPPPPPPVSLGAAPVSHRRSAIASSGMAEPAADLMSVTMAAMAARHAGPLLAEANDTTDARGSSSPPTQELSALFGQHLEQQQQQQQHQHQNQQHAI